MGNGRITGSVVAHPDTVEIMKLTELEHGRVEIMKLTELGHGRNNEAD